MADDSTLSGSLQETIVTALAYATDNNTRIISQLIDLNWFEDPYREIVSKFIDYWRQNKEAPGASHIDDVLDYVLKDPQNKKYNLYSRIVGRLAKLNITLNTKYVYNRLFEFARRQNLKRAIFEAGTILSQSDSPEDYDKVESILAGVTQFQSKQYDLGFSLANLARSLKFLSKEVESSRLQINIPELDREGINPGRGEVFLIVAPRGRGKSMFLHHIGRSCLNTPRWNGLHITLENSEDSTAQRYFQGNFNLTTRQSSGGVTLFNRDNSDRFLGFLREESKSELISNPELTKLNLQNKIEYWEKYDHRMSSLRIKGFPTGDLSFDKLNVFLDHLESFESFTPDIIILDYPDLMDYDMRYDPRHGIGRLYQQLRGLADKRNLAMVVATQSNREGENAKVIESHHTAEDISKIATSDYVITYNQTKHEYDLGIARLYVAKARNERQWFTVLISQNYAAAQFVIDSCLMAKQTKYNDILKDTEIPTEC